MVAALHVLPLRFCRGVVALVFVTSTATVVLAVAEDKAVYVGGTLRDFPIGGVGAQVQSNLFGTEVSNVEGRITTSESELVFAAGGKGTLSIPYKVVVGLAYGLEPHGIPEGGLFLITWDPLDQYTKKAHYLLSIRYLDQQGAEQGVVFELGKNIVRPTLAAIEARTGKAIEFTHIDACLLSKAADECGYGASSELRGLTTVFVDAGEPREYQDMIMLEIEKVGLGLKVVPSPDGADVILRFRGREFRSPDYLQALHGGRGEAVIVRDGRSRTVVVFSGTRMRAFGDKPATKFGAAFVAAYREANPR